MTPTDGLVAIDPIAEALRETAVAYGLDVERRRTFCRHLVRIAVQYLGATAVVAEVEAVLQRAPHA